MSPKRRFAWRDSSQRGAFDRYLRLESLEDRRLLSITVNTLVDENDGVGVGGISLRDAIAAAPVGETIDFEPILTSGGPVTILLTRGQLLVHKDLTIVGPGAALLSIDATGNDLTPNVNEGNGSRVFNIDDGASGLKNIVISGLRLTGGDASGPGGAILVRENLRLVSCVIAGNSTFTNTQLGGGGIYSSPSGGPVNSLTLIDCSVTNNLAARDEGGGIRKQHGSLTLERCTITGNSALLGGGLSAADGGVKVQIHASTFSANTATTYDGGGIFIYSGVLTLTDSTLSGNSAAYGAGIYFTTTSQGTISGCTVNNNNASIDGGGIYVVSSQLTLTNSTVSTNFARGFGGGVAVSEGTLALKHSTVTANRANSDNVGGEQGGGLIIGAGTVTLDHTIVAGNFRGVSTRSDVVGAVAARFSLIGDRTSSNITDNGGNLIGSGAFPINPMLGPLADNGGPTTTHALLSGSQAIDAGDPAAMVGAAGLALSDQRGAPFTRVFNGDGDTIAHIDIGAYELQGPGISTDFDDDHDVDGADFLFWQRGLGASGEIATKNLGNADGDADVDGMDLTAWRAAFGAAEEAVAVAIKPQRSGVGQDAADRNERTKGRLRPALTPEIVDAAMAREQLLDASESRRLFRRRVLRSR